MQCRRLQPYARGAATICVVVDAVLQAGRQAGRQHLGVALEAPRYVGEGTAAIVLLDA